MECWRVAALMKAMPRVDGKAREISAVRRISHTSLRNSFPLTGKGDGRVGRSLPLTGKGFPNLR
jgi:hypothetical protein